ncbi:MAG: SGNH/GDSL hydrolase family protein [Bacillota bacterium]|nr:SGNH/GDSL hydrolase family protein [Bacillota bacterium]
MMKLCALGDSITAGIGVPDDQPKWTELVEQAFADLRVINFGIGGQTSSQGLVRFDSVAAEHPDIVTIQYGMNDHCLDLSGQAKVPLSQFRINLITLTSKLLHISDVILITNHLIIEGDDHEYYYRRHPRSAYLVAGGANAWLGQYNVIVRETAHIQVCGLVDMEKIASSYDPKAFLRSLHTSDVDDGVHPHALGARIYAEAIISEVERRHQDWRKK